MGGTIKDGCFLYSIQPLSSSADEPQNNVTDLLCTDGARGTGLNATEALNITADFCEKYDGQTVTPDNPIIPYEYLLDLGDSAAIISVWWYQDCAQNSNQVYKIEKQACVRHLGRTINECNNPPGPNYGKDGGNVTDRTTCGVYELRPIQVETMTCNMDTSKIPKTHTIDWPGHALGAIQEYCDVGAVLDPKYIDDDERPADYAGKDYKKTYITNEDFGYTIKIWPEFTSIEGCWPKKKFWMYGNECHRKLQGLANVCK